MEEKQKVQVVFEFDREEYEECCFLMDHKKPEEAEKIWNAMCEETVVINFDLIEGSRKSIKLMMISLAILSVKYKV